MVAFNQIDQFDDKKTWDLICDGNTKGVFQLESKLGSGWAKRAKPRNINELSDLIAIIRPGTLDSIVNGKSMTRHYVDRKSGKDEIEYLHDALEPILKNTQGVLVYQEQAMRIAIDIAGFSETEADSLRKAVGKKDAALMKQVKEKFIIGAVSKGVVGEEDAYKIFDLIQASARYSFNACLSPDTIVELSESYCTIEDLNIGDYIFSPDGFIRVINKYYNGPKEVFRITLESGKSIECTLDHKFLCDNGEILPLYEIIDKSYSIVCELE